MRVVARLVIGAAIFVTLAMAWLPVAFYFHLLLLAARVYRRLGYWPRYQVTPDPTALATTYDLTVQPVDLAIPLLLLTGATGVSLAVLQHRVPPRRSLAIASAFLAIMWVLVVAIARIDPGGVMAWSID